MKESDIRAQFIDKLYLDDRRLLGLFNWFIVERRFGLLVFLAVKQKDMICIGVLRTDDDFMLQQKLHGRSTYILCMQ